VLLRWLPVLAWMGVIFAASSSPFGGESAGVPDWVAHACAYLVLSLLVCRALAGRFRAPLSAGGALLATLLSTAYGVSDEYHQSFVPGRDASARDVASDFAGSALGAVGYGLAARRKSD
jgi:VanZ family protein